MMNISFLPEGVKVLSISELTQSVKSLLEDGFARIWLSGEISGVSRPASGHYYLTLKDAGAQLKGVIWRSTANKLRFDIEDGMEVIAFGRLTVYAPRGEYQLSIEQLHPKGIGGLELAFRQLREKLTKLGYFDPQRKRPLPAFPRRIALVTSSSGAAIRDMLEILGRRWPTTEILICSVRVQGDGAAAEIAAGIRAVNEIHESGHCMVDVMIVGRGGGSIEDLWAFNEEAVAQAIFASRIPVISAVGHETDVTIADFVADRRALTPSEAAELVVPHRKEQLEYLNRLQQRLRDVLSQRWQTARRLLDDLTQRKVFRLPLEGIRDRERRLDELGERLRRGMERRWAGAGDQIKTFAARLEALSPLNVLSRGYSLTRMEAGGAVVRSPEQVRPGDRLETHIAQGRILSRVEEVSAALVPSAS